MTRIKPTVSLFRVWQRELNGVLAHFSTTYTLYYCGYAFALPWSSCYSSHVTHCDCDLWCDHMWPSVTPKKKLWHCDKVTWYFPMLHLVVVNKKRKEKKRNINNDLANLPSHDMGRADKAPWRKHCLKGQGTRAVNICRLWKQDALAWLVKPDCSILFGIQYYCGWSENCVHPH